MGFEEDQFRLDALPLQIVQHLVQLFEVPAAAGIGHDRCFRHTTPGQAEELAQGPDHLRGEVVDAEVAGVFECGDRLGLPGPGQAGDDDHLDRLGDLPVRCFWI